MNTLKIGRTEYEVKKGDYILNNGACYQFCSGDGRALKIEGFNMYANLRIPKSLISKIPFTEMDRKQSKDGRLIYYIFK
jgi:hypothetical protein